MDREARQEYNVVIQAKDMGGHMGGLSGTTEVKITLTDVNDNPPKFPLSECEHETHLCVFVSPQTSAGNGLPSSPGTRGESARRTLKQPLRAVSHPAASHHLLHVRASLDYANLRTHMCMVLRALCVCVWAAHS